MKQEIVKLEEVVREVSELLQRRVRFTKQEEEKIASSIGRLRGSLWGWRKYLKELDSN